MTDIVDIVTVKPALDERLENIFRQLLDLYERHAQERQLMIKEKEELARLVQLLVSQTKEIGQYEQGIRKRIQDCIKDAADVALQSIELKMVDKNSFLSEQRLFFYQRIIVTNIVIGIIVVMLLTWLLMR